MEAIHRASHWSVQEIHFRKKTKWQDVYLLKTKAESGLLHILSITIFNHL